MRLKFIQKEGLITITLLLLFAAAFEFLPAVKEARRYVSAQDFENFGLSCGEILSARPWYGKVNQWFLTWIILVPALVCSFPPGAPPWRRGIRTVLTIIACYVLMNLAVHLQWDIRNAPFSGHSYTPGTENGYRMDCVNTGDGFSHILALTMGWIPACVYTGFCLFLWHIYHVKYTKRTETGYKNDIITHILFMGVIVYAVITFLFMLALAAHSAGFPEVKPIGWLYYFTIRPLLIPIEIFWY